MVVFPLIGWWCTWVGACGPKISDRLLKVSKRLESLVNTGESEVRDLIEIAERTQNCQPDVMGVDFSPASGPNGLFYLLGQNRQLILAHRSSLAGLANPDEDLASTEGLGRPRALDYGQASGLEGGKTTRAFRALPTTTNRRSVFTDAGVNHPRIKMTAEGTVHNDHLTLCPDG
jgi:hypothetical protein